MKKIFFLVAVMASAFGQYSIAKNNTNNSQSSQLLAQYYAVKDALVSGNAGTAAAKASEFVKTAKSISDKAIPEASRTALLKDAGDISKTKNIKKQREYFAGFSDHMFALTKTTELSTEPIYKAYCPMKKASWLSSSTAIKNPYFGSAMLTCGKVVETLK